MDTGGGRAGGRGWAGRPAVALVVAAVVAGCGGGGATATDGERARAVEAPASRGEPTAVLASREATLDEGLVRLTVTDLRRRGPTVVLNVRLQAAGADRDASRTVGDSLGDGRLDELADGATQKFETFDGPFLVDPGGRRKYLVALDASGACVCSNDLGAVAVEDGPVVLQAVLSAPPSGVQTVDLTVPRFGTFPGVPLDG